MTDLILLGILLLALLWGWYSGGVRVLAGIGALIVAFQVARYYSGFWAGQVVHLLPSPDTDTSSGGKLLHLITMFVDPDVLALRITQVVLFVIIFLVTRWLINKLAALVTGLFGGSIFGLINHTLGGLLGAAILIVVILFIHSVALPYIGSLGLDIAYDAQVFLERSRFVLPLIYALPQMLGLL